MATEKAAAPAPEVNAEPAPAKRRGRPSVRRELVEREIKENAARLFAERGVAGTTLQDIADATGLTRQAVYHYVANKDELFAQLVSEVAAEPAQLLREINAIEELDPATKLNRMAESIALNQMASPDRFRLLIRSEADLPESLADGYRTSRRQVLRELTAVIDAGVSAGAFRDVDARTAALGVIGMLNWIAWWYRDGDDRAAIAAQLAEMAVRSLRSAEAPREGEAGPLGAIEDLRRNLDRLERMVRSADG
ncbi:TetR family transcriptional regulator [Tsukamurella pseudospumae]|uniref:TetR family transcriptional regulator n=1 Tax=Tsukamurella pseudospumae TaxID=239498 RepID=A0A138A841_9ACTN|nr:TetR family transcriptional regulator [Tsukamurella pseudospumae]KXP06615.1 TetR family transcriptional regulator [Tsukamurella pseudospumae]